LKLKKIIDILAPGHNTKTYNPIVFNAFQTSFHYNDDKKNIRIFSVVLEWSDQEQVADLLNRYVESVALQTKQEIISKRKGYLLQNKINIEQAISSKRAMAAQRRSDEIVRLSEALYIAKGLKINKYSDSVVGINIDIKSRKLEDSVNNNYFDSYLVRSYALAIQIEALKNRKSDDPFIEDLRILQEQLVIINDKLLAVSDDFEVARIDQQAFRPTVPIKPIEEK